jgi:predicted  nucleic acid-binding Zn-ribbon protein
MPKSKKLECGKCGHVWNYKGDMEKYATCPDCHRSIKISESMVK